ncbi:MAG: hypothetical protein R3C70_07110 [Geminicoccaceae bacterium]
MSGFRIFRGLAPGGWFRSVGPQVYVERYFGEILAKLDPKKTFDQLHALAHPHEPVLLCWEKAPLSVGDDWWKMPGPHDFSNWCHRRMVARWFEENLGVSVPEFNPAPPVERQARLID